MSSERWHRIESLYHAALALPESERPTFLHDACGDDEILRQDVESLLAQPASDPQFLATQVVTLATRTVLRAGTSVGPYEVVGFLGSGGMGEVYRARDAKLGRDVALKILPDEFASDPARLARFKREAQVLASLSHPHI